MPETHYAWWSAYLLCSACGWTMEPACDLRAVPFINCVRCNNPHCQHLGKLWRVGKGARVELVEVKDAL